VGKGWSRAAACRLIDMVHDSRPPPLTSWINLEIRPSYPDFYCPLYLPNYHRGSP
jgi:hypothetical protein